MDVTSSGVWHFLSTGDIVLITDDAWTDTRDCGKNFRFLYRMIGGTSDLAEFQFL